MFFKIVKPTNIFRMTSQDLAALVTLSSAVPVFLVLPCFHSYHPPFCAKSKPAPCENDAPFQADFACWHHLSSIESATSRCQYKLCKRILNSSNMTVLLEPVQKLTLPGRVCLQDRPLGNMLRFCKWSDLTLPVEDVEIKSSQQSVQKLWLRELHKASQQIEWSTAKVSRESQKSHWFESLW